MPGAAAGPAYWAGVARGASGLPFMMFTMSATAALMAACFCSLFCGQVQVFVLCQVRCLACALVAGTGSSNSGVRKPKHLAEGIRADVEVQWPLALLLGLPRSVEAPLNDNDRLGPAWADTNKVDGHVRENVADQLLHCR